MEFVENSLNALAEQLIAIALKSGAEAAEVFQHQLASCPVFFEANRLKQLETSYSDGLALRLWQNSCPGLVVAHGLVDPQMLVDRALALSQLNEPEIIELNQGNSQAYLDVGEMASTEQLIAWGKTAIALVREPFPESVCTGTWECESETTRLVNSHGLDISYTDTTLSSYLSAEWIRGDDFLVVADGQTQRNHLDPNALAAQLIQRLQWASESAPSLTGRMPVIFTSKAADMIWGTVQAALNGKQVLEKASPWSDRLKTPVMSSSITLYQQPQVGPFSCPFDDEGTPTQTIVFVQDGVLESFYTDRTISRLMGSSTTGNGFRPSLSSYPTPGLFNFMIQPGKATLDELVASLETGLIVDQMLGGGAGISGEFSINVELGYLVRNGQVMGRVKDTMVSGNIYAALKHCVELGNDGEWNGFCWTPSLMVEGLFITGRS
jgi:PmbA protein